MKNAVYFESYTSETVKLSKADLELYKQQALPLEHRSKYESKYLNKLLKELDECCAGKVFVEFDLVHLNGDFKNCVQFNVYHTENAPQEVLDELQWLDDEIDNLHNL